MAINDQPFFNTIKMTNLIDKSYFWGELEITGLFKEETEAELNQFITKYQKKYIKEMFGNFFNDTLPESISSLLVDADTKISPIANYVYFYWQRAKASIQTNAGVKGLNTQNTITVSPAAKQQYAWNEMAYANTEVHETMFNMVTVEFDYLNDIFPYFNTDMLDSVNFLAAK